MPVLWCSPWSAVDCAEWSLGFNLSVDAQRMRGIPLGNADRGRWGRCGGLFGLLAWLFLWSFADGEWPGTERPTVELSSGEFRVRRESDLSQPKLEPAVGSDSGTKQPVVAGEGSCQVSPTTTGRSTENTAAKTPPPEEGPAAAPGEPALTTRVQKLLKELESPRRQVRGEAERQLLELGPAVLPLLPDRKDVASESVRGVLARVRPLLQERAASQATRPSQLQLRGTRTLRGWCAEIFRQTGNRVLCDTLSEAEQATSLTGEVDEGDFWPGFEAFWRSTPFHWRLDAPAAALRIERRVPTEPLKELGGVVWSGVHRVAVERVQWKERPNATPLVRVGVRVTAEPRIRHLLWQFRDGAQQGEVVQPGGGAVVLRPFSPESQRELPPGGGEAQLQFDFEGPQRQPGQRVKLGLNMTALVAPVQVPLRFGDLTDLVNALEPVTRRQRAGGVEVTLERVSLVEQGEESGTAVVRVAVLYNHPGAVFESYRNWILHNEAWLERSAGEVARREAASEPTFEAGGRVGMAYRFLGVGSPRELGTFVYSAPALMIELPVRGTVDCAPID